MLRSLYSGVSGMRSNQTKMDVIGNNISNVNTTAFKYGRVRFQDMLSQTMSNAQSPSAQGRGGVNPQQVGLGVSVAAIDTVFEGGALQPTGRDLDFAIENDGFFIVSEDTGGIIKRYTRDGAFFKDYQGNLVSAEGLRVLGYQPNDGSGNTIASTQDPSNINSPSAANLKPLSIPSEIDAGFHDYLYLLNDIEGKVLEFQGLENSATGLENKRDFALQAIDKAYEAINIAKVSQQYSKTSTINDVLDGTGTDGLITHINNLKTIIEGETDDTQIQAHINQILTGDPISGAPGINDLINAVETANNEAKEKVSLEAYSIDGSGLISAVYNDGQVYFLGRIGMAMFENPGGLEKQGGNTYIDSRNSGVPQIGNPSENGFGLIRQGNLEMSNVDLANEFTEMIVTSRAYQANSRTITTSDEMLQELINLKR